MFIAVSHKYVRQGEWKKTGYVGTFGERGFTAAPLLKFRSHGKLRSIGKSFQNVSVILN